MSPFSRSLYGTLLLILLILGANTALAGRKTYPILSACTRFEEEIFEEVDFSLFSSNDDSVRTVNAIDEWKTLYHDTVSEVVEEAIGQRVPGEFNAMRREEDIECDASSHHEMLPPGSYLESVARRLPSWKDDEPLYRTDMGVVLLELLQQYECALIERSSVRLHEDSSQQEAKRQGVIRNMVNALKIDLDLADSYTLPQGDIIKKVVKELRLARRSLERTLTLLSSLDSLRPLEAETLCMQRSSLDIRNGLALAADASSCLPRIWDTRTPLRDIELNPNP